VAHLTFQSVAERGLTAEQVSSRRQKEQKSLQLFRSGAMASVGSLEDLHAFVFQEHAAYAAPAQVKQQGELAKPAAASSSMNPALKSTY